ncbi:5'-methylthioadenosine phosphorylase protein [Salinisphaera shabanensis E1L3A]|jgi:DNA-binding MarR family transcriptional regulator|uniref:5'-methylthioadenosine phosphorylase protein n=1 Tax=Salinisphaera shabanensis E1L3A TaxID=1033802 RepID=U2EPX0_9GAMM|nr:MarR family transcriptional regulator [Salinisphaera shabanensis]ERJ20117.1 5'-methylthioadenosine phosphorylase protein [Salinisphaera shabanensis E1L3A]
MPDPVDVSEELAAIEERSPLLVRPGFLIRRLHQIHSALFTKETEGFNITPVQYSVLTALAEHGELDQMTLAHEIGLERTSVGEVLRRLEQRELVERRQSTEDGRVRLTRATHKGRQHVQQMTAAVQRAHERTVEALAGPDRDLLVLYLARLVEANNEMGTVPFRLR